MDRADEPRVVVLSGLGRTPLTKRPDDPGPTCILARPEHRRVTKVIRVNEQYHGESSEGTPRVVQPVLVATPHFAFLPAWGWSPGKALLVEEVGQNLVALLNGFTREPRRLAQPLFELLRGITMHHASPPRKLLRDRR